MGLILITGANGNVGAEVLNLLQWDNLPLRAAARVLGSPQQKSEVDWRAFDFRRPETFDSALQGVSKVFLVRPPDIGNVKRDMSPFLMAMKEKKVERVVFLSLLGAEKNAWVPHHKIEEAIKQLGLPATFLRASFFMQNLSTTHAPEIQSLSEVLVPAGKGATSFVDVRDVAAVAAAALVGEGHVGRCYDLTGDTALSYYQVAELLSKAAGRHIVYSEPSVIRFVRAMRRRKLPWVYIAVMVGIYTAARTGNASRVTHDIEAVLGRKPISFQQFAQQHARAWEETPLRLPE